MANLINVDVSSALVKASDLTAVLFIGSDGRLTLNTVGRGHGFFFAPLEGQKPYVMDYREVPTRREDVLPLDLDRLEASASALKWYRAVSLQPGSLFITSNGTHVLLQHMDTGLARMNLATRVWDYLDENEVGLAADSWTLNGYGDGRVILSLPCKAVTG
jgi:hypothetical protein